MNYIIIGLLILIELQIAITSAAYFSRMRGKKGVTPTFIDTSALMDGRIGAVVASGFIPDKVIIPRSVLLELQTLADGSDTARRTRARNGLDIAKQLQDDSMAVTVLDDHAKQGVDDQLIYLAKRYDGTICTIDFNLNKVAQAEGISVLNLNDLAQQLRMNYLPGERTSVLVAQKGNDAHQGVGYLTDGTMIVVEHARADIGQQVAVEIIKSIQTAAGKMLFAKKISETTSTKEKVSSPAGRKPKSSTPRRRSPKPGTEDSFVELANRS